MASVLTDQVLRAKLLAPVSGILTTAKLVQFSTVTPFGQTGNASIAVPATTRVTGNPFRVRVQGTSVRVAASTMVLTLRLDGVSLGTFTAVSATANTSSFSAVWDVLFESATIPLSGTITGWGSGAIVAATVLATPVTSDLTAEGHLLTLDVLGSGADAAASVTISEFSLEVL